MFRNRFHQALIIGGIIIAGLLSRTSYAPPVINPHLGDVLYAIMIYFMAGFLFPKAEPLKVLLGAFMFCVGIEITQLFHPAWLEQIRSIKLFALVLGHGFKWTDLVLYLLGSFLGFGWEKWKYPSN